MYFNVFNLNIIFTCNFFFNDRFLIHLDIALITEKYVLLYSYFIHIVIIILTYIYTHTFIICEIQDSTIYFIIIYSAYNTSTIFIYIEV